MAMGEYIITVSASDGKLTTERIKLVAKSKCGSDYR